MSTAPGDVVRKRRPQVRKRPRPITLAIIALIVLTVLVAMLLVITGTWPLAGFPENRAVGQVTPTTPHAAMLKVEAVGAPVRDGEQVTLKAKITNNILQSAAAVGTPTPNAATATPGPAKVLNASVKVFYYYTPPSGGEKTIVGSGVGNYFSPQGLASGESAEIDVVATDVGSFNSYEVFPDTVWTDKDPVKAPEAGPTP
ncbi:MAG: hypothetical protein ABI670_10110 [Chloroflexota bacterium]